MTDKERTVNDIAKAFDMPICFEPMASAPKDLSLEAFHEWNAVFALAKFKAKMEGDDDNISFFNMKRGGNIHIMKTMWRDDDEKIMTFDFVRTLCMVPEAGVEMISMVQEVWVATVPPEDALKYPSVRETPGHEDALLVSTFARAGGSRSTRWVVRLHPTNPAKHRMLERDDTDMAPDMGRASNFFEPEKPIREMPR